MTTTERSQTPGEDVPPDIAAERAAIEDEIAGSTLLTAYAETVAANGDVEAHRWKDGDGTWHSLTYREVRDRVRDLALGLAATGFRPGEFAAVWSGNRTEATVADYAVMHARGVPVFIYNTVSAEQAAYILGHCEATVAIVESKYLPRLLEVRAQLPKLRQIILIDGDPPATSDVTAGSDVPATSDVAAASGPADAGVVRYADVLARGAAVAADDPGQFESTWRKVAPDDLATLIYTSGTTGTPKGVMIAHRNVRFYQLAYTRIVPSDEESGGEGAARVVSYLPMAHVTGRSVDHWSAMARPVTLAFCPEVNRIFEYAAEVHPTGFMGIPRVWEKLYAALSNNLPTMDPGTVGSWPEEIRGAILARIGLDQCTIAASGSAPLDPKIIDFFRAVGVPLTEGWGMSELSNAATFASARDARTGAVGRRFPGVEIKIADDGEVLVRGPLVMGGYYHDPERTTATLDAHGWLHTGDVGELDADGFLKITDRKKELIITSGGKNISPALVEYQLQRHPLIGQAVAVGDGHNYVTALIVLDPETAPAWARAHGLEDTSLAALAGHPDVVAEIQRGVDEANEHLARVEQVRRFKLLGREWTADTGELTPTQKRRRRVIMDRYAREIDQLYS